MYTEAGRNSPCSGKWISYSGRSVQWERTVCCAASHMLWNALEQLEDSKKAYEAQAKLAEQVLYVTLEHSLIRFLGNFSVLSTAARPVEGQLRQECW